MFQIKSVQLETRTFLMRLKKSIECGEFLLFLKGSKCKYANEQTVI